MSYEMTVYKNGSMLLRFDGYPTAAQLEVVRENRFIWSRTQRGYFGYCSDTRRVVDSLK